MISKLLSLFSVLILTGLLIPVSVIDIKQRIIPNGYPIGIAIAGVALMVGTILVDRPEWKGILFNSALGLAAGAGVSLLCRLIVKEGIGLGDVKLLSALGLYQGIQIFPQMLAISSVLALAAALILKIRKQYSKDKTLPFAPFLAVGAVAAQSISVALGGRV